ncbi:polyprenyl synthetase family protein [Oceanitalea stevensii]|uniref:Polyprenyl synthetase family protein n=1 Tax=Oceanitalea stevensii TaxID=2763072 RepID=A0ABR8YZN0_9MICO|nr:polyprenyl synthetase family protein [Oceanitalea stevensii]MBD8061171.1 polyprenyl synthetase family protein [Oceanitalea stevensii]
MAAPTAGLATLVTDRVATALREHTRPFESLEGVEELLSAGEALLGGGKRLRAAFCTAGWTAFTDRPVTAGSAPVLAGSALELFQGAALAHDDLMDGSLTRRGLPAVHRRMAGEHAERGWLGDPDRHGAAGAILLGDLLLSVSSVEMDLARRLVDDAASTRARATWDLMTTEVAVGQYLDVRSQVLPWNEQDDVDRALTVVQHKSARYSVEHPLVLGAALAGAPDEALAALRRVGLPLGVAFQLWDDVLGVFGEPEVTGKPAGDDLREGKRTVLLALALRGADAEQRATLQRHVGRPDLSADDVALLRTVLETTGAVEEHQRLVDSHLDEGLAALDTLGLPAASHEMLTGLARRLTARAA